MGKLALSNIYGYGRESSEGDYLPLTTKASVKRSYIDYALDSEIDQVLRQVLCNRFITAAIEWQLVARLSARLYL